jgi:hypothetical protein
MTGSDLAALAPAAAIVVGIGAGIIGRRIVHELDEQRSDRGPKPPARRVLAGARR